MRLSELNTGEKGVIVKVLGHGGFRKRIVEMGFIKGKTVEVILNAPLKDPIKYRLLDYEISLRRQEAEMIEVVSEQEARTTQSPYHGSITEEITVPEAEMVAGVEPAETSLAQAAERPGLDRHDPDSSGDGGPQPASFFAISATCLPCQRAMPFSCSEG